MGRKYKQEKIYTLRDEINALDRKKGILDWYNPDDKEVLYWCIKWIRYKLDLMLPLILELEQPSQQEIQDWISKLKKFKLDKYGKH